MTRYRVSYYHPFSERRPLRFLTVQAEDRAAASRKVTDLIPGAWVYRVVVSGKEPLLLGHRRRLYRSQQLVLP